MQFVDVTRQAGIDFVETIGDDEMSNIVEATGVGCGLIDYDGDGWLDVYLVSGCWKSGVSDPNLDADKRAALASATDRLYRNRGDGRFEDVTVKAGVAKPAYGMGVVAADYDADGDVDLYVTNDGPNFLYRNNGDGTFAEVAEAAGVADPLFSVGAVFLDYDRDGWVDLYVGNYVTYVPGADRRGSSPEDVRSPLAYEGQQDHLYRNIGNGTFTDVTAKAGLVVRPVGRAMGVGTLDFDEDGWPDVFVSNDAMENFLFHNLQNGTFENVALSAGVAFGESGDAAAAMAAEVGDVDADGRFDLLVPDMNRCCLYVNLGRGFFDDASGRCGLARSMIKTHGWGGILADFDLDGDLDIYVANGSACRLEGQPDALLVNAGSGRFELVAHAVAQSPDVQSTEAQSTMGRSTEAQSTMGRSTVDQPTVDQPTVDQPTVDQPTVDQPTVDQPTVDQPTVAAQKKKPWAEGGMTEAAPHEVAGLDDAHLEGASASTTSPEVTSPTDTVRNEAVRTGTASAGDATAKTVAGERGPIAEELRPDKAGSKRLDDAGADSPAPAFVSRGVAQGDIDNDGDVDLLVASLNARPCLLLNETPRQGRHWLEVQLEGLAPNRGALGAVVRVRVGGRVLLRQRVSAGSYLSQHDSCLHFGLGRQQRVESLEVVWPDGTRTLVRHLDVDQRVKLRQEPQDGTVGGKEQNRSRPAGPTTPS